jgi:hypothetical protein
MTRLWNWLRGHDLQVPSAPAEPVSEPDEPLIPPDEPERHRSTSERKARGVRARIQREEIESALDGMVRSATEAWASSRPDEEAKREEAYRQVNLIRALRTKLRAVESDGEMAARQEQLGH